MNWQLHKQRKSRDARFCVSTYRKKGDVRLNPVKVQNKVVFNKQMFRPQILYGSPNLKVPLICMEAGQEIPPHPSGTGIFYVLEGKGVLTLDDEKLNLSKGTIIVAPEGSSRGIKCEEKLVVVAIHAG